MPLLSAQEHFANASVPPRTAFWFDAFLVPPIALIDAPMVVYDANDSREHVKLASWCRVIRNEPDREERIFGHLGNLSAVDIVHRDFFQEYLTQHAMPFANEFARLAVRHNQELASGRAFASGFGDDSWTNIEQRIRPEKIEKGPPRRFPSQKRAKPKSKKRS